MRWDGRQGSAEQIAFPKLPHIPRVAATPESLFPSGDDLDSSQLQMERDEMDTLREGEDPGTPRRQPRRRGGGGR